MKPLGRFKLIAGPQAVSLNLFSLAILVLADIFLAVLLFHGLSQQIDQLTSETEYFPYRYRQIFIRSSWVENNIVSRIGRFVLDDPIYTPKKTHKKMHPVCTALDQQIDTLKNAPAIVALFRQHNRLQNQYRQFDSYQKNRTGNAGQILDQLDRLTLELRQTPEVSAVIDFVFDSQKKNYDQDIQSQKRWFALKRTGFGLLFLLPVIAALAAWNMRAAEKQAHLPLIISSHFILVALLPIGFEISRLVLELMPRVLLVHVYDFLLQARLVSLWYYILIILTAAAIFGVIWFLQTRIFTRKRYLKNKVARSKCMDCGFRVNYEKPFCPNCGAALLTPCPGCKGLTFFGFDHCRNCGRPLTPPPASEA